MVLIGGIGYNLRRYFTIVMVFNSDKNIKLRKAKYKLFFTIYFIILYISSKPYAITLCLNLD